MRRHFRFSRFLSLVLPLGLIVVMTVEVKADLLVSDMSLFDGKSNSPTAWISFNGSKGSVDVYADPLAATNWTSSGSSIALYCTDLLHTTVLGSSYDVNVESKPTFSTVSAYSDAANRVAWALESVGSTATDRGATQLLLWSILDKTFKVTNWSNDKALKNEYNLLVKEMGDPTSGYNPKTNYLSGAEFLGAVHDSTGKLNQDLALAIPPGGIQIASTTPEPSSMVIACLGTTGLLAYARRRRSLNA